MSKIFTRRIRLLIQLLTLRLDLQHGYEVAWNQTCPFHLKLLGWTMVFMQ